MVIYLVKNTINGKLYIGRTSQLLKHRWRQHRYDATRGRDSALCRAIRKYGESSFTVDEIFKVFSESDLGSFEIYFIDQFKTRDSRIGYNMSLGGEGHSVDTDTRNIIRRKNIGRVISTETKEKLKAAALADWAKRSPLHLRPERLNPATDLRGSPEHRAKVSEAIKAWWATRREINNRVPINLATLSATN